MVLYIQLNRDTHYHSSRISFRVETVFVTHHILSSYLQQYMLETHHYTDSRNQSQTEKSVTKYSLYNGLHNLNPTYIRHTSQLYLIIYKRIIFYK